jgi:hypothetical protein
LGKLQISLNVVAQIFSLPQPRMDYSSIVHIYWRDRIRDIENVFGSIRDYKYHARVFMKSSASL